MNTPSARFDKILSSANGVKSLVTPDFRFVEYSYPRQDFNGPHLPQTVDHNKGSSSFDADTLAAFVRLR